MLLVALVTATVAALVGAWRAGWIGSRRTDGGYAAEAYAAGESAFEKVRFAPLKPGVTRESVRAALAGADVHGGQLVNEGAVEGALDLVADLFYHRFCQSSPAAYRAWRDGLGDVPRGLTEMIERGDLIETYRSLTGRELPPADYVTVESVFDELWEASLAYGGGYNRAVAIASDDAGVVVHFGLWTPADRGRRAVSGRLPADVWRGGSAGNLRSWWRPPVGVDAMIEKHGRVVFAEVGVVLAYADGSRRPHQVCLVFDPDRGVWVMQNVTAQNLRSGAPLSPMEY